MRRQLTAGLTCGLLAVALAGCAEDPIELQGQQPGYAPEVDLLGAVALYVIVPLVLLLGIAALVWLPGMVRGARYRPGRGWSAPPVWFAGPPDPAAAVESAPHDATGKGGASGSW